MRRKIITPAFSLIEMLMALLVASLLLAALAPVITKRLSNENISINSMTNSKPIPSCAFTNDTLSDITIDNACKVPEDVFSMSAIIASGGGGGGGAIGQVKDSSRKIEINGVRTEVYGIEGAARNQDGYTVGTYDIDSTMSDIEVEIVSGGSGGADPGVQGGYPSSQSDCGDWGYYLDYTKNAKKYPNGAIQHSICVAIRNPGDGATAPSKDVTGVTSVPAGTTCSVSSSGNCCWYGNTGASGCNSTSGSYSGCTRTVCQWSASKAICSAWRPYSVESKNGSSGRLPTLGELDAISRQVKYSRAVQSGQSLLQFCALNTNADSEPITNCIGISGAVISHYWGDDGESASNTHSISYISDHHYYLYGSDILTDAISYIQYRTSVGNGVLDTAFRSPRCVIDNVQKFEAYHGGGGSGGMYVRQKIPNEVLQKAFTNPDGTQYTGVLKLMLYAGYGGDWHSNENKNLTRGVTSFARLIKDGKIIWSIGVPNSFPGSKPDPALAGSGTWSPFRPGSNGGGAFSSAEKWCTHYNAYSTDEKHNTASKLLACNDADFDVLKVGYSGYESSSVYPSNNANAGFGGRAYWRTAAQALAGTEGQYSESVSLEDDGINGKTPVSNVSPGSGGSGGYCTQGPTKDTPICGKGGNGAGGAARFTYKKTYPGAGGGGGGAGKLVHIKGIPVNPNTIIKVQVGGGGGGGAQNGKGQPGGNTFIELSNGIKYEVTGGGGGKIGTLANLSTAPVTYAKGGDGGDPGTIPDETLNKLKAGDEYYPNTNDDIKLAKGNKAEDSSANIPYISTGASGGINTKISTLAGVHGIPCGAYSKIKITINNKSYECGSDDIPTKTFDATPLTRSLISSTIEQNISNYIKTYAPGSTGGGGGGWSINSSNGTENIGKGASGMGGYVILYFQ